MCSILYSGLGCKCAIASSVCCCQLLPVWALLLPAAAAAALQATCLQLLVWKVDFVISLLKLKHVYYTATPTDEEFSFCMATVTDLLVCACGSVPGYQTWGHWPRKLLLSGMVCWCCLLWDSAPPVAGAEPQITLLRNCNCCGIHNNPFIAAAAAAMILCMVTAAAKYTIHDI